MVRPKGHINATVAMATLGMGLSSTRGEKTHTRGLQPLLLRPPEFPRWGVRFEESMDGSHERSATLARSPINWSGFNNQMTASTCLRGVGRVSSHMPRRR